MSQPGHRELLKDFSRRENPVTVEMERQKVSAATARDLGSHRVDVASRVASNPRVPSFPSPGHFTCRSPVHFVRPALHADGPCIAGST